MAVLDILKIHRQWCRSGEVKEVYLPRGLYEAAVNEMRSVCFSGTRDENLPKEPHLDGIKLKEHPIT